MRGLGRRTRRALGGCRGARLVATVATVIAVVGAAGALVAGPSRAASVSWRTYGFNAKRSGYNGSETTIGTGNVSGLHKRWSVDLGGVMIAQPVVAAAVSVAGVPTDVVYEGTEHGDFYAIRATDGHVIWHRNLGLVQTTCYNTPDGVWGIGGAAAIAFTGSGTGVVYVAGGDGSVHAIDLATGAERPGWPVAGVFTPAQEHAGAL